MKDLRDGDVDERSVQHNIQPKETSPIDRACRLYGAHPIAWGIDYANQEPLPWLADINHEKGIDYLDHDPSDAWAIHSR